MSNPNSGGYKISFVNRHTHESTYLTDVEGKDVIFPTLTEAESQLGCLSNQMNNGRFVIVEQY